MSTENHPSAHVPDIQGRDVAGAAGFPPPPPPPAEVAPPMFGEHLPPVELEQPAPAASQIAPSPTFAGGIIHPDGSLERPDGIVDPTPYNDVDRVALNECGNVAGTDRPPLELPDGSIVALKG